ncbi:hypothetical protein B0H19DRAFT_602956 [Mycena capillaripes]|nr:hypothetical protein B0H19DRAFT_602956 [Mycena capillaripes]
MFRRPQSRQKDIWRQLETPGWMGHLERGICLQADGIPACTTWAVSPLLSTSERDDVLEFLGQETSLERRRLRPRFLCSRILLCMVDAEITAAEGDDRRSILLPEPCHRASRAQGLVVFCNPGKFRSPLRAGIGLDLPLTAPTTQGPTTWSLSGSGIAPATFQDKQIRLNSRPTMHVRRRAISFKIYRIFASRAEPAYRRASRTPSEAWTYPPIPPGLKCRLPMCGARVSRGRTCLARSVGRCRRGACVGGDGPVRR